jgi:hypothetical protein
MPRPKKGVIPPQLKAYLFKKKLAKETKKVKTKVKTKK